MTHQEKMQARAREWFKAMAESTDIRKHSQPMGAESLSALLLVVDAEAREDAARIARETLRRREGMSSQDEGFKSAGAMVAAAIRASAKGET